MCQNLALLLLQSRTDNLLIFSVVFEFEPMWTECNNEKCYIIEIRFTDQIAQLLISQFR